MRNPERILNSLTKHSKDLTYKFERLYRILFNEELYLIAYKKLQGKSGNMTQGVDSETIDGMSLNRIKQLIETLKDESYQPKPSKRVYIPKKNGSQRPLGIPSFNDKLLQEVLRMILEAIYEGSFENTSHGFRPQRSCHTALNNIQKTYTGTKWFIEGDIKGFFDNINHNKLIMILSERIADERFIRLIRKFLNAGYMEDWKFQTTHSGTPQGGIISPILANIYLDKLDKYMMELTKSFNKGHKKCQNTEAKRLIDQKYALSKKLEKEKDESVRKQIIKQIKDIIKERRNVPACNDMDDSVKKISYTRYADDFLIGVIGSKADCIKIKEEIKEFLNSMLNLELSEEKTLITNAKSAAKFLSFEIFTRKSNDTKRNKNGNPIRSFNGKIVLYLSTEVMKNKLLEYDAVKITTRNGKEAWESKARTYLYNNDELEILTKYNAEIMGLYNYYCIANNSCVLNQFYCIMEYSMYKTYAGKLRSTIGKVITKYTKDKVFRIPYTDKKGNIKYRNFYHDGFKRKESANLLFSDNLPNTVNITEGRNGLITKLKAQKCELCGSSDKIEVHHVRKLKDLKGKKKWEQKMIARNRKTMVLCSNCHHKLHAGKLD
ncbi:MAG: reverse transcriptase/maturase family protein [bacterium]